MPQLALYLPDIPQNVGSLVRLSACFGTPLHIIEPCGFPFDDKRLRRVALDYIDYVSLTRHSSWDAFLRFRAENAPSSRLVFITNQEPSARLNAFAFRQGDFLLLGQESAGFHAETLALADHRVIIPMQREVRSLNVAQAGAIALAEALRQTERYP